GDQLWPPLKVNHSGCWVASAATAMPWLSLVMPTQLNPPVGAAAPSVACRRSNDPSCDTVMSCSTRSPTVLASTTRPSGWAATAVTVFENTGPAGRHALPPSLEANSRVVLLDPASRLQSSTRLVARAAASAAPDGCPLACGAPGTQLMPAGSAETCRHDPLPSTGPA